jgi:predicted DNA binding CopG/RHH family protein
MKEKRENMPKELKPIPTFQNEDEEREFWASHDSTEYVDWDEADEVIFSQLKPSTRTISLRLPELMLNELRLIANKRDIPYQSLIKLFLKERIDEELKSYSGKKAAA